MDYISDMSEETLIRRYPEVLSCYMKRGGMSVFYAPGRIKGHLVFYPFILPAQVSSFITRGTLINVPFDLYQEGNETFRFRSLEWMKKCFPMLDVSDYSIPEQCGLVLVWDEQASVVGIQFEVDSQDMIEGTVQSKYLQFVKDNWKRQTAQKIHLYSEFYGLTIHSNNFAFGNEPFSFPLLNQFVLNPDNWNESDLFVSFCFNQLIDKSDIDIALVLDVIRAGFVSPRTIFNSEQLLNQEWCYHTKYIISNAKIHTEKERIAQKTIIKYCNGYLQDSGKNDVVEDTEPIPHYTSLNYEDNELLTMCHILKKDGYIDSSTKDEDFIYCMTGRGQRPVQRLVWKKSQTLLCVFVKMLMMEEESTLWTKTAQIFAHKEPSHRLNGDSLRNNYARAKMYDAFKRNEKQIQNLLTDFL